jgi:hypothetical protein
MKPDKNLNHEEVRRALRERLREDLGNADEPLLDTLQEWRDQEVKADPIRQKALIAQLENLVSIAPQPRASFWLLPLLIMRAQLRIVRGAIFVASALVMVIGVGVTLALYQPQADPSDLPLVLVAPLVTAFGLAILYSTEVDSALEIEQTTPVSPALIMLARIALVFGFDLAFGLIGSVALTVIQPSISLWPLVVAWLAPMAFLSALAFLLSVFFLDSAVGIVAATGLWALFIASRYLQDRPMFLHLPDFLAPSLRPLYLLAAIPLFLLGLWLCEQREIHFRRS